MSDHEVVKSFAGEEAERQFVTLQETISPLMIGDIEPVRPSGDVVVTHDIGIELYDEVSGWEMETLLVLRTGPDIYRIVFVRGSPISFVETVLDNLSNKFGTDVTLRIVAANEQFTQEFLEQTKHRALCPTDSQSTP